MRDPQAPYLELGFYFHGRSRRDSLECLVMTLLKKLNAAPIEVAVIPVTGASCLYSDAVYHSSIPVRNASDLIRLLNDPSRFVTKVTIENGTQIVPTAREFIVVQPMLISESENAGNSVSIWVEGEVFSRPAHAAFSVSELKVATRALARFKELVAWMLPTYAAITVDYGLETPYQLRNDTRTIAFRDFYLSQNKFGKYFLAEIRSRYPNCIHENYGEGQLTITTPVYRKVIGNSATADESFEISQFIAEGVCQILT